MEIGKIYEHPYNGLYLFLGWDRYFGETTAKFNRLEYSGSDYLTIGALRKLGWV